MRTTLSSLVLLSGALAALGCSASAGSGNGNANGTGGNTGGGSFGGSSGSGSGGIGFMPGPGGGQALAPDAACRQHSEQAEKQQGGRADVIFALDNSGSMGAEAIAVQTNMNTFSQYIAGRGIDVHVVVISSGPSSAVANCAPNDWLCLGGALILGAIGSNGVCIDPPLGLPGACPNGDDTNLAAGYMHWRQEVGSNNALAMIQQTFNGWQSILRADAAKTFIVVTDDENNPPPTGQEFVDWVNAQPVFQGGLWRFSGVFCVTNGSNCAALGPTYSQLVTQTGGIAGDMAAFSSSDVQAVNTQFQTVFNQLGEAVVADAVPVSCEWTIPEPPEGEQLDPSAVNVHFTGSDTVTHTIYGVGSAAECTADHYAWYYDDPQYPQRVIACPQACAFMQADLGGRVDVLFGCATEPPPIQ